MKRLALGSNKNICSLVESNNSSNIYSNKIVTDRFSTYWVSDVIQRLSYIDTRYLDDNDMMICNGYSSQSSFTNKETEAQRRYAVCSIRQLV